MKIFGILAVMFVLAIGSATSPAYGQCRGGLEPETCVEIGAKYFSVYETEDGICVLVCEERNAQLPIVTLEGKGLYNLLEGLSFYFNNARGIPPLVVLHYTHEKGKCPTTWLEFLAGPEREFLDAVGKGCESEENVAASAIANILGGKGVRHITDVEERGRVLKDFRASLFEIE